MNNDGKIQDLERLEINLEECYKETSDPAYFWAKVGAQMAQDILSGHDVAKAVADLDLEVANHDAP